MRYMEFGKENGDVVILLHGGGLSWWNYREAAALLETRYRVILPILDGHAGSDRGFSSIEDNADEIIGFVDEHFGGSVLLMGGLSLGGQVLLEILSRRGDICRYAIIESALALPSKLTHAMIAPAFGSCYGLIRKRWFAKLQFRYLRIRPSLFEDYYRDTRAVSKADMIRFMQANALYDLKDAAGKCAARTLVLVGGKEGRGMRRSAGRIGEILPDCAVRVLPGMYHGELSINRSDEYVKLLSELAEGGC